MARKFTFLRYFLLIIMLEFSIKCLAQSNGDFKTKNAAGNWSDFNSWYIYNGGWLPATAGQIPTAGSNVYIDVNQIISVDNAYAVCNDLNVTGSSGSKIAFSTSTSALNIKGNMNLYSTSQTCFGTWAAGAKIVFSGTGSQGFAYLSSNSPFINIEVNKPSGMLTTSSNFRFGSFTLTSGSFNVSSGNEIQGISSSSTVTINGGTWTQTYSTTKINNAGNETSPIGALTINGGTMVLATSNKSGGFQFSSIDIKNGGVLTLQNFTGLLNIATSLSVDATSTLNTALDKTPLPASTIFNGIVNYNNTGDQTISSTNYSYLKISGKGTKTLAAGTTTIPDNGTLEMAGVATSPILDLSGNILSVSAVGTQLIYSSSGSQTARADEWNNNFQKITIDNTAGVNMTGLSRTIYGSLNLVNGTFNIGNGGSLTLDNAPLNRTNGYLFGTSTSDLVITGTSGGTIAMPLSANMIFRNLTVSGTRKLVMDGTNNIYINGTFNIDANATFDNGGESQVRDGGTGSLIISGKFINRDKDNFTGSGGAIPSILPTLNPGCTVEYGLPGNQVVSPGNTYQNITFSGSGIKTPGSSIKPLGTVYITGSAILDASGHNIGDSTISTNLVMDGGRFIVGTTGTQPSIAGAYNLTGGVIQFDNSTSGQTIRSPKTYYAIEVTGTSVGNSLGNINLAPNGTFTVKSNGKFSINADQITGASGMQTITIEAGGIFECGNANGFSGGDGSSGNSTSIKSNIETIILSPGSTVSYSRANDQTITNQMPYQNFLISGTGIKTAPSGTLIVQGNLSKSGTSTFSPNGGTVLLNGESAQSFAGLTYNNLLLTNGTKTTAGTATIIDSIKINAVTNLSVSNGDTVILHSDASKTARVGQVDGTINYNTSGVFTVERYFPDTKAWRFLAVPINSSQKIKDAWQEGAINMSDDPKPGYGIQITDNISDWMDKGFDAYSVGGPSMKTYNGMTDSYTGIAGTIYDFDPAAGGYMTFIRGNRQSKNYTSPVTSTVLRTTGRLFTGSQPAINVRSGKILPVNNPYASSIDLRKLSASFNVFYYVFDPKRGGIYGYGAYQTLAFNGSSYEVVPGGGSYGSIYNFIENGQAFFVSTLGTDTLLAISEYIKSDGSGTVMPFIPNGILPASLRTNLYRVNPDGSADLADGVLCNFAANYSNSIDGMDARKFLNSGENLSLKSGNTLLAIERKNLPRDKDTIFFSISGVSHSQYRLQIIPSNWEQTGADAYLEDNYLKAKFHINPNDTSEIYFTVNDEAASASANRFRIIFMAAQGTLPVTFTNVKAYRENEHAVVKWKVENESGIKYYEVQSSNNGTTFNLAYTIKANNTSLKSVYRWVDDQLASGYNYYRIKSIGFSGDVSYSSIVKIFMEKENGIIIYSNPVKGGIIHLKFMNQAKGNYTIKLLNEAGAIVATREINFAGGSSTVIIKNERLVAHGIYTLIVTKPDGSTVYLNLLTDN